MDRTTRQTCPWFGAHKTELGTAAIIAALGVGSGIALPEDQSMPYPHNRIIAVRRTLAQQNAALLVGVSGLVY